MPDPMDPTPGARAAGPAVEVTDLERATATFQEHRPVLFGVAYRIVGQVSDAEDVVQEAWMRWAAADRADVRDARAFLVRVTVRLAIDRLRRVQARRETYISDWLPEPLLTGGEPVATVVTGAAHEDPAARADAHDDVSMALLLVLATLSPLERAVFVLREAFRFSHAEIAEALDRTEPAVRQLAARARQHVAERRQRFDADPVAGRQVAERFLHATTTGDVGALMRALSPDVTLVTDSGGAVRAPRLALRGAEHVARFLVSVAGRTAPETDARLVELNGSPGVVASTAGEPAAAMLMELRGGVIERLYLVANPAKLAHLRQPPIT